RARAILEGCRFERIDDLQPSAVVEFLAGLRRGQAPPTLDPAKEWYTVREAAAVLGVTAEALGVTVRRGPSPAGHPGQRRPGPVGCCAAGGGGWACAPATTGSGRSSNSPNGW